VQSLDRAEVRTLRCDLGLSQSQAHIETSGIPAAIHDYTLRVESNVITAALSGFDQNFDFSPAMPSVSFVTIAVAPHSILTRPPSTAAMLYPGAE